MPLNSKPRPVLYGTGLYFSVTFAGMNPDNINKPTFIVNETTCKRNIERMLNKAKQSKVIFRPHFKTHQSAEIGEWFRDAGVTQITVSSVTMAEYFARHGWDDILIAFPVNILEIDQIHELSRKINLQLLVESEEVMKILSSYLKHKTGIYIKIDTGYHRTGLEPGQTDEIEKIINVCKTSKNLHFRGFLSHFGQTYATGSKKEIFGIYQVGINRIKQLKEYFNAEFPSAIISIGDTPSCSLMEDLSGADEIRPGNFVFYDVMQYKLGSCDTNDIAVAVACPVVAKHASRNEIAIYGGAVHLSKEFLANGNGSRIYGLVVNLFDRGWSQPLEGCYVSSLSQEHGIMKCPEKIFHKVEIGSLLGVLPVHSCLTANLASHYLTLDNMVLKTIHSKC